VNVFVCELLYVCMYIYNIISFVPITILVYMFQNYRVRVLFVLVHVSAISFSFFEFFMSQVPGPTWVRLDLGWAACRRFRGFASLDKTVLFATRHSQTHPKSLLLTKHHAKSVLLIITVEYA
jgi:hypothetical protein